MELPRSKENDKENDRLWLPQIDFKCQITFPSFLDKNSTDETVSVFHKNDLVPDENNEVVLVHGPGVEIQLVTPISLIRTGEVIDVPKALQRIQNSWFYYTFLDGITVYSKSKLEIRAA